MILPRPHGHHASRYSRNLKTRALAVEEMYALYQQGATLEDVGEQYGISGSRVGQHFKAAGLNVRSRGGFAARNRISGPTQRVADMYTLYLQQGATLEAVGEAYGITRERVRQLFNKAGLPTRSHGQAGRLKRLTTSQTISLYIDEHRPDIIQTFRDRRNIETIAAEYDLPIPTVRAILKDALPAHEYRALRHKPPPKKYTDDDLIGFLRKAGAAQDGILTIASYQRFRRKARGQYPTPQVYTNRFGSWLKALHAAGMPANVPYGWGGISFDVEECLAAVRAVQQKLGKPPTSQEYEQCARESEGSLPSLTTVGKRCGGWIEALRRAGV